MSEINLKNGGRPMLYWAGKHPIEKVNSYPAQLIERVNTENVLQSPTFNNLKDNWSNLLFHGDNKEILSTLLTSGFRSKIDLIYIDPPFDSKADYIKKIKLRKENKELQGEEQSLLEQVQYTDIWRNDEYLQFIYERLILLRELLSEQGSIYLHCDWHKSHHLRCMMDEVFGEDNFVNEIVWKYETGGIPENFFAQKHDMIFLYRKSAEYIFNKSEAVFPRNVCQNCGQAMNKWNNLKKQVDEDGRTYRTINSNGKIYKYYDDEPVLLSDVWMDISHIQQKDPQRVDYPTQKPEALLERIIKASSNPDSIILDCFCGSGTTPAVAEKLGRKWIACDINKGAIQTTIKRLQNIINEEKTLLDNKEKSSILHYKVNNYDFQEKYNMEQIIRIKYGVENINNNFFDGTIGEELVKIVDLNKPLTKLDIELIKNELKDNQTEETRNIVIICNGSEVEISSIIEAHNKKSSINKIKIRDIQKDGIITYNKPEYDVQFNRNANKVEVEIKNYISPTILERLQLDKNLFEEQITDFRSMIDYVLIDNDFKGDIFNIYQSDIPERKNDFITGKYSIESKAKIAIKIVDMLGEESLVVEE